MSLRAHRAATYATSACAVPACARLPAPRLPARCHATIVSSHVISALHLSPPTRGEPSHSFPAPCSAGSDFPNSQLPRSAPSPRHNMAAPVAPHAVPAALACTCTALGKQQLQSLAPNDRQPRHYSASTVRPPRPSASGVSPPHLPPPSCLPPAFPPAAMPVCLPAAASAAASYHPLSAYTGMAFYSPFMLVVLCALFQAAAGSGAPGGAVCRRVFARLLELSTTSQTSNGCHLSILTSHYRLHR